MNETSLCVLGGAGFVGTWLVNRLAEAGHRIRIPTRHAHRHQLLLTLPAVDLIEADVHDPDTLAELFAGCSTVINLVGILNEHGRNGSGFRRAHVELAQKVVAACQSQGVARLLHMSALNADAEGAPSHYLRTKGEAEDLVHSASGIQVTSFRPSVIFGPGDTLFNRFATFLRLAPVAFPLACPEARFAPVYVDDVARAFVRALDEQATYGQRYNLCGPQVFTLRELVDYTAATIGVKRYVVGLGAGLSRLQAALLELVPGKPFSRDNYQSLQVESVCSGPFPPIFGIDPVPIDVVVPGYLGHHDQRGRYQGYRQLARRG